MRVSKIGLLLMIEGIDTLKLRRCIGRRVHSGDVPTLKEERILVHNVSAWIICPPTITGQNGPVRNIVCC